MHRCLQQFSLSTAVVICLAAAGSTWAADYYVSPSGNDSGAGAAPGTGAWQTISKVNVQSFAAGDRIFFEGGQGFVGTLGFGSDDTGTAANPIIVSSYGGGRATINAGSNKGLSIYNTAGIAISELILTGAWGATSQSGNTGNGIEIYMDLPGATKLDFVHIDNVEVRGFKQNGILIGAWPADGSKSGWANVQLAGCVAHDNGAAGISSFGYFSSGASTYAHANIVVRDCTVYSNRGVRNTGNHSGDGIVLADVNGATIERCLSYDNGELCNYDNGGPIGIWTYDSNAVLIQFNESHSNKSGGSTFDGGGFDLDGGVTNSTVQYNYSHGNQGAGYLLFQFSGARPLLGGNVIRYNISENDGRKGGYAGIVVGGGSAVKNNRFHNNTIYISPAPSGMPAAVKNLGVGTGNTLRNNIIQSAGGVLLIDSPATATTNLLFQGNNYWSSGSTFAIKWGASTYATLAAWRTATAQEKNGAADTGSAVDPLLNAPGTGGTIGNPALLCELAAYRLQPASPMINSGLDLLARFAVSPGSRDYFANPLPQGGAYDIGAHEFGVAPAVAVAAAATPNPATHGSAALSVIGADNAGEANLLYTWAVTGTPPAPVVFGANGTNAAKNTSATFSKAGAYSFSVTITNAAGLSATSSVAVTVNQTFGFWLAEHGLTGDDALPDADPYGIGIGNLLAYALGIEPQAENPNSGLPAVQILDGFLTLAYEAPRSDVIYQPEWSANLSGWTTTGISSAIDGTTRAASVPVGPAPAKFLRLRINRWP
jgi:hypothetical protein